MSTEIERPTRWIRTLHGFTSWHGYIISRGSIPSPRGYRDVWSAYTGLPPAGVRIPNSDSNFFESESAARDACEQHAVTQQESGSYAK